jgi:putative FmdB family regulatory protein|tara:strand:+ start:286 stop:582 length:297 start_codon:yes stop_codon:yes gene_type:complete
MPLYNYDCSGCERVAEVLIRRGHDEPSTCEDCGGDLKRRLSTFATPQTELDKIRSIDPQYKRMVEDHMARTPEAEPMRHLNRLTPFSAAEDPGDPIDF